MESMDEEMKRWELWTTRVKPIVQVTNLCNYLTDLQDVVVATQYVVDEDLDAVERAAKEFFETRLRAIRSQVEELRTEAIKIRNQKREGYLGK